MRRSAIGLLLALALGSFVVPLAVDAQAPGKAARIGWLRSAPETPEAHRNIDTFTQELRDQGYSVGQNVTFTVRAPTERTTPLSALMGELLQFQADVIVAGGPAAVDAARQATTTVPIVALDYERDPVASGLVERYSHPGGNLTGVFLDFPAFSGKWLELLREVVPGLTRVAVLWDPATGLVQLRGLEGAARAVGVQLHVLEVRSVDDFAGAFRTAMPAQPDAVIALSATHRLPAMTLSPNFAREGGLMAYGPDPTDIY